MMRLVFKKQKSIFLLKSLLLKHSETPVCLETTQEVLGGCFYSLLRRQGFRPQIPVADQVPIANTLEVSGLPACWVSKKDFALPPVMTGLCSFPTGV